MPPSSSPIPGLPADDQRRSSASKPTFSPPRSYWLPSYSWSAGKGSMGPTLRSEEHTSELQSHSDLHSFPTRRSSDLPATVVGIQTHILAAEELLASKLFVVRRERFDGADIAHIIYATAGQLDWSRILELSGAHWEMLFWSLVLFRYI